MNKQIDEVESSNESFIIKHKSDLNRFLNTNYEPIRSISKELNVQTKIVKDHIATSTIYFYSGDEKNVEPLDIQQMTIDKEPSIRIGTYNVLFNGYYVLNEFDRIHMFNYNHIDLSSRCNNIIKRIEALKCDILCCQEVSEELFIETIKYFNNNVYGIYIHAQNYHSQGLSVFYKPEKFNPIHLNDIIATNNPNNPTKVALYIPFKRNECEIIIANAHLPYYGLDKNSKQIWKKIVEDLDMYLSAGQLNSLTNESEEYKEHIHNHTIFKSLIHTNTNIIYLGDYNTDSKVLQKFFNSTTNYSQLISLITDESYHTCYDDRVKIDSDNNYQYYSIAEKVDHIVYKFKGSNSNKLSISEDLTACNVRMKNNSQRQVAISTNEPSDHLPVVAVINNW
jgi:hypothetical protein